MLIQKIETTVKERAPSLHEALSNGSIMDWESKTPVQLANLFRDTKSTKLSISSEYGGDNLNANELKDVLIWTGSRCPSLSVMKIMHHHTTASLNSVAEFLPDNAMVVQMIAEANLLIASAFAEGDETRAHYTTSKMKISKNDSGYIIQGSKKPCTMTNVMDMVLTGINYTDKNGDTHIGSALIDANDDNLKRKQFWNATYLKSSDSNELIFDNVLVPDSQINLESEIQDALASRNINSAEDIVMMWLQLLTSSAYFGMVIALITPVLIKKSGSIDDRAKLIIEMESIYSKIESISNLIETKKFTRESLYKTTALRMSIQSSIDICADLAFELSGGINFIKDDLPSYLFCACRAIKFHPPFRTESLTEIVDGLS